MIPDKERSSIQLNILRGDERSIPPVHLESEEPVAPAPSRRRLRTARMFEGIAVITLVLGLVAWARASYTEGTEGTKTRSSTGSALPAWPSLASPALAPANDSATCEEEKRNTRAALAEARIEDAIAAGRRAVKSDESDGDAWRLLSDAYGRSGRSEESRRALASCRTSARGDSKRACVDTSP